MIVFQSFWLSAVRWLGAGGDFAGFMFGSYFFLRNSRPRTREGPTRSTDRFPWRLRSAPIPLITNHLLSAPVSCRPRFEQWSGQRVIRLRRPGQDQVGPFLKDALVTLRVAGDQRGGQQVGRIESGLYATHCLGSLSSLNSHPYRHSELPLIDSLSLSLSHTRNQAYKANKIDTKGLAR